MATRVDLITHPVRARILLAIMGRALTTHQIATLLADIPRASLYRHIRELAERDVLMIVEETRIRGTVEKRYAVRPGATLLSPEDVESAGHEEYLRLTTSFLGGLAHVYEAYLAEKADGLPQEVVVRVFPLQLTTDEFQAVKQRLMDVLSPLEANRPTAERRRRIICLLGVPDQPDPPTANDESVSPSHSPDPQALQE